MTLHAVGAASWPQIPVVLLTLTDAGNLPQAMSVLSLDAHEVIVIDGCSVGG